MAAKKTAKKPVAKVAKPAVEKTERKPIAWDKVREAQGALAAAEELLILANSKYAVPCARMVLFVKEAIAKRDAKIVANKTKNAARNEKKLAALKKQLAALKEAGIDVADLVS